ncbi:MAG: hypothetical protein KAR06_02665 [Deltaproteobacteria bacterium]|nr:hypothetical protein [Deltaproteobacteria bacterium]
MAEVKQKRDWQTPAVLAIGAVGLGTGLYLYFKKPPGAYTGDTIRAHFTFDYDGPEGVYILQVSFGSKIFENVFHHIPGWTWDIEVVLDGPGTYEFDLLCELPREGPNIGRYNAEATIRTPGMDWLDYLIKKVTKDKVIIYKGPKE